MEHGTHASHGLSHYFSHDNLHIVLDGQFEQIQADTLMEVLRGNQEHCKRIFIDVRRVAHSQPSAVTSFKSSLRLQGVGPERVYFKGNLGFDLAINGNKVLIVKKEDAILRHEKKYVCKGNCAHCTCGHHHH